MLLKLRGRGRGPPGTDTFMPAPTAPWPVPTSRSSLAVHMEELVRRTVRQLSPDMVRALQQAARAEKDDTARGVIETILERATAPDMKSRGLATDAGLLTFFVRVGCDFPAMRQLHEAIRDGVEQATKHEPLAPHTADIKTGALSKTNTGRGLPVVHTEVVPNSADCRVTVFLKGAASDALTTLWMLPPKTTMPEIGDRLASMIADAGGKPCPPIVVGVGIGGTPERALMMSREALLRPVGEPSPEPFLREHEPAWRDAMNATGIGPMGLGGDSTVLAVHAACEDRHMALMPVAVSVACWSDRRATLHIERNGDVHW